MKNEFLPYDRALKLKELGFDEPCIATHGYLELYINICVYLQREREKEYFDGI